MKLTSPNDGDASPDSAPVEARHSNPRRFVQFGMRTVIVVMTLCCIWLAWRTSQSRLALRRQTCKRLAETVLLSYHWRASATDPMQRGFVQSLASDFSDVNFKSKILGLDGSFSDGSSADAFEKDLLARFEAHPDTRGDEFVERSDALGGPYVFYRPVRATKSCLQCHRGDFGPAAFSPSQRDVSGALMGIVKIELLE